MDKLIVTTADELKEQIKLAVFAAFENQPKVKAEPQKNLHSIKELADYLGCSAVKAQQLKNSGRIRFYQDGRKVIFVPAEILEDLKHSR